MKTWLITGAGSGLGKAIAQAALERGDRVVGTIRDPVAARSFRALNADRAFAIQLDITDRAKVFAAVAEAEQVSGGIDILVNNAGQVLEAYVEDAPPELVRGLFEVNLIAPLSFVQAVLPYMRKRRSGRILNISSGGGIIGVPSVGLYSASKFALEGMSEALAAEVGPLGIDVTIIEPGAFRTNLLIKGRTSVPSSHTDYEASAQKTRSRIIASQGREPGDPNKLARAVMIVADAENPPMRVALGDDAIAMALGKCVSIRRDIDAWREVGTRLEYRSE
jgi:NAD(P)-dependent dehydrogenase (short-subunit alcohol dehydrogenase family)